MVYELDLSCPIEIASLTPNLSVDGEHNLRISVSF